MGWGGERSKGSAEPPFDTKFHFHGKFWIHLVSIGYPIYPKESQNPYYLYYISLQQVHLGLLGNMCKIVGRVTNSVDPDQTFCSAASDLGLHCLLRPVCPNT